MAISKESQNNGKVCSARPRNALLEVLFDKYGSDFDLDEFHSFVRENYTIHCSVEKMAAFLSVSVSKFQKDFKEVHGESYYSFMKKFVLKKAAVLLEDPSLRVTDIALKIGYENISKFSSAFYDLYGVSPTEYRNQKIKVK